MWDVTSDDTRMLHFYEAPYEGHVVGDLLFVFMVFIFLFQYTEADERAQKVNQYNAEKKNVVLGINAVTDVNADLDPW